MMMTGLPIFLTIVFAFLLGIGFAILFAKTESQTTVIIGGLDGILDLTWKSALAAYCIFMII